MGFYLLITSATNHLHTIMRYLISHWQSVMGFTLSEIKGSKWVFHKIFINSLWWSYAGWWLVPQILPPWRHDAFLEPPPLFPGLSSLEIILYCSSMSFMTKFNKYDFFLSSTWTSSLLGGILLDAQRGFSNSLMMMTDHGYVIVGWCHCCQSLACKWEALCSNKVRSENQC